MKELDRRSTLTINKATEMDEGYYQCLAKNAYGTALSNVVDIRMAFIDYSTAEALQVLQKTVVEGKPFHIKAELDRSYPEQKKSWCKTTDTNADFADCVCLIFPSRSHSQRIQMADNGKS